MTAALDRLRTFGVTACNRVSHGAHGKVHRPTYHIPRAPPAHHLGGRTHVVRQPTPGGRGSPPLRWDGVDGQRYCIAPTLHQPLSHAASRRDSSPFRGAKGWAEICGVYASVSHDADTYVSHPPVRGGVPDAPRLRDCRGAVVADGRRDRLHPRHPRCARLRPPPHASNPAGTARAPFHTGAPTPPSIPSHTTHPPQKQREPVRAPLFHAYLVYITIAFFGQTSWQVPQPMHLSSSSFQIFSFRSTVRAPAGHFLAQSVQ